MEHRNEYPPNSSGKCGRWKLFGLNIPEEYGGAEVDTTTLAMVFEEGAKGWLGLAGVIGSNSVMCDVLVRFGTGRQKRRFLPAMALGEKRGGICLTESNAGTDLQNISTTAIRERRPSLPCKRLEDVDHQCPARQCALSCCSPKPTPARNRPAAG